MSGYTCLGRLVVAFTLSGMLACGGRTEAPAEGDGRLEVVARHPIVEAGPTLALGHEVRQGICRPSGVYPIRLAIGAEALRLSLGARFEGEPERTVPPSPVRFRIARRGDDAPLATASVSPPGSWQQLDIPIRRDDDALSLEVETSNDETLGCFARALSLRRELEPAADRRTRERRAGPNILLLSLDTLGAGMLESFGAPPGASPTIDELLRDGFSFRRAFAQYPSTFGSHSALFSGLYPRRSGRHALDRRRLRSLVSRFAQNGYLTAAVTEDAFVGSHFGFEVGFDEWSNGTGARLEGNAVETFTDALEWMTHNGDKRFFLFVHTYQVHAPYRPRGKAARALTRRIDPTALKKYPNGADSELVSRHNRGIARLPAKAIARLQALHQGEVRDLDDAVSGLLAGLEELALTNDTLVVLTSDHGELFGEGGRLGHGTSLHDRVLHVPLGFRWPGRIEPGASEAIVQLVDVLPTVADLAGVPLGPGLDGRSLAPLLLHGIEPEDRPTHAEMHTRGPGPESNRSERLSVRTPRFKLIHDPQRKSDQLIRLENDPNERNDVSARYKGAWLSLRTLADLYQRIEPLEHPEPQAPLDEETRRQLLGLGYLDELGQDPPGEVDGAANGTMH